MGLTLIVLLPLNFGDFIFPWSSATAICLPVSGGVCGGFFLVNEGKFARGDPIIPLHSPVLAQVLLRGLWCVYVLNLLRLQQSPHQDSAQLASELTRPRSSFGSVIPRRARSSRPRILYAIPAHHPIILASLTTQLIKVTNVIRSTNTLQQEPSQPTHHHTNNEPNI
jgi:hypothetical protein